MKEIRKSILCIFVYTICLLSGNIIGYFVKTSEFPFRALYSVFYFVLLLIVLFRFETKMAGRDVQKKLVLAVMLLLLLLIIFRTMKYEIFIAIPQIDRFCWYLYYIPLLAIPILTFYSALLLGERDISMQFRRWWWTAIVSGVLIVLVLTNDLHQLVFRFQPGFVNWDSEYSHGFLFAIICVWEYGFYLISVIILLRKCRVLESKRDGWIPVSLC